MSRRLPPALLLVLCLIPADLRAQAPGVKKPFFDSAGVQIHYTVQGKEEGEPVLLIHGFTANIGTQWAPVIKELSRSYKVIAMDCRGHGGSEKPHDPKKYGLEMARDAVRLLDYLKIEKAHIVGYSMGGYITLQIAARYPEHVRTATIGGAGVPPPEREKLLETLADSLEKGKGIAPLLLMIAPKDQPKPTEEQVDAVNGLIMALNDPRALAAVIRGAIGKELALTDEQVKNIKVPLFAPVGSDDPFLVDVEGLKKLHPETQVLLIDKADHITAFSRREFIVGIREYLDAHRTEKP